MFFTSELHPEILEETHRVDPDDLDEIDSLFFDTEGSIAENVAGARPARIVALVSPKGGTGKTCAAVMLAGFLTTRRRKVGLMDLDPHHGVEKWAQAGAGLPFPTYKFNAKQGAAAFREAIRRATREVDLLILDTPPTMGAAIDHALQVADVALVPAGASAPDLEAARVVIEAADQARHGRDGDLPKVIVLPSRQDGRTRLARDFAQRFKELDAPVAPAIGQRVEVAAAANSGRLVGPSTAAGKEFRRLSRHIWSFLRRMEG